MQNNNGINFMSLLQLLFIGLKLTGYIDWSWIWVLSPTWGSIIVGIVGGLILYIANHWS